MCVSCVRSCVAMSLENWPAELSNNCEQNEGGRQWRVCEGKMVEARTCADCEEIVGASSSY